MKTTSSKGYYVTLKYIFAFCDVPKQDLKNGWNFLLVWYLDPEDDIP